MGSGFFRGFCQIGLSCEPVVRREQYGRKGVQKAVAVKAQGQDISFREACPPKSLPPARFQWPQFSWLLVVCSGFKYRRDKRSLSSELSVPKHPQKASPPPRPQGQASLTSSSLKPVKTDGMPRHARPADQYSSLNKNGFINFRLA